MDRYLNALLKRDMLDEFQHEVEAADRRHAQFVAQQNTSGIPPLQLVLPGFEAPRAKQASQAPGARSPGAAPRRSRSRI